MKITNKSRFLYYNNRETVSEDMDIGYIVDLSLISFNLIICVCFNGLRDSLIFTLLFLLLRRYTGRFHFDNRRICLSYSCLVLLLADVVLYVFGPAFALMFVFLLERLTEKIVVFKKSL